MRFAFALLWAITSVASPVFWVFPPAKSISAAGVPRAVSSLLSVTIVGGKATSQILADAVARHAAVWLSAFSPMQPPRANGASPPLASLRINLASADEMLNAATDYSYSISIVADDDVAVLSARSVYGAMYALSTLSQLLVAGSGTLPATELDIFDAPDWPHRGLMIDAGRRFFPVPLVQNLIDTMALAKLNVLHMHVSDECRFGIESKLFPNLTAGLTDDYGGFYTQVDITALVAYGQARGVRIMPEFDIPGHSRGLLPLAGYGAVFCDPTDVTCSQLYGDPENKTYEVLTALLEEVVPLFIEPLVHLGCDETGVIGPCTVNSTFQLERYVLDFVQKNLGRTPAGWEEVEFDAAAATPQTVVYAWSRHDPLSVVSRGLYAVDSNETNFYLTAPGDEYPAAWASFYYDIGSGLSLPQKAMLHGGEVSQWTDTYCGTAECGAGSGPRPIGSPLFPPSSDAAFAKSIGGMIFPRALVGAAAFWGYNASQLPTDPAFVAAVWALNDQVVAAGGLTCPSRCACDQLTQCGQLIVPPSPPSAGMHIGGATCVLPVAPSQSFVLDAASRHITMQATDGSMLCVASGGSGSLLTLVSDCSDAAVLAFTHNASTSWLMDTASGRCVDLATDTAAQLATLSLCAVGLLSQGWAVDADTRLISSFKNGACLTGLKSDASALKAGGASASSLSSSSPTAALARRPLTLVLPGIRAATYLPVLAGALCTVPVVPSQAFLLTAAGQLSVQLPDGSTYCVANPGGGSGNQTFPLGLAACGDATVVTWARNTSTAWLVDVASGGCLHMTLDDVTLSAEVNQAVGLFRCFSGPTRLLLLEQAWAIDDVSGAVTNLQPSLWGSPGACLIAA